MRSAVDGQKACLRGWQRKTEGAAGGWVVHGGQCAEMGGLCECVPSAAFVWGQPAMGPASRARGIRREQCFGWQWEERSSKQGSRGTAALQGA